MEADLQRWYQVDIRDRWRFGPDGVRRLTLRRLGVLIRALPPDSATAVAAGGSGWRLADHLLADLFHASTGKPHPGLPKAVTVPDPERDMRVRRARARARERQRAIDAGEIT